MMIFAPWGLAGCACIWPSVHGTPGHCGGKGTCAHFCSCAENLACHVRARSRQQGAFQLSALRIDPVPGWRAASVLLCEDSARCLSNNSTVLLYDPFAAKFIKNKGPDPNPPLQPMQKLQWALNQASSDPGSCKWVSDTTRS